MRMTPLDSPDAWVLLAQQLVQRTLDALRADEDAHAAVLADLKRFNEGYKPARRTRSMEIVGQARGRLLQAEEDALLDNLKKNAAPLEQVVRKLQINAGELEVAASRLKLKGIEEWLGQFFGILAEICLAEAEASTLTKDDRIGRLGKIAKRATRVVNQLADVTRFSKGSDVEVCVGGGIQPFLRGNLYMSHQVTLWKAGRWRAVGRPRFATSDRGPRGRVWSVCRPRSSRGARTE